MNAPRETAETAQPEGVAQFFGLDLFEHYQEDGYLLVVTSDATALRLEPGDFIVRRMWSTAVAPCVYNRARPVVTPTGSSEDGAKE